MCVPKPYLGQLISFFICKAIGAATKGQHILFIPEVQSNIGSVCPHFLYKSLKSKEKTHCGWGVRTPMSRENSKGNYYSSIEKNKADEFKAGANQYLPKFINCTWKSQRIVMHPTSQLLYVCRQVIISQAWIRLWGTYDLHKSRIPPKSTISEIYIYINIIE